MSILEVCEKYSKELIVKKGKDITNSIVGKSIFSKKRKVKKRYFLEKRWSDGNKILTAIMMNPSRANEVSGDETVNQIINQAKKFGYDALYVVNLSPFIEGSSSKLKMAAFNYDELNWEFIIAAIQGADKVFLGWGMKGQKGLKKQLKVNSSLYNELKNYGEKYVCYELILSTSKNKYDPKYYVPHPRPWKNKKIYLNKKFIDLIELEAIFSYKAESQEDPES